MVKSLLLLGTGLVLGVVSVPLWPAQAEVAEVHEAVQGTAVRVSEFAPKPTDEGRGDDDASQGFDRTSTRPDKLTAAEYARGYCRGMPGTWLNPISHMWSEAEQIMAAELTRLERLVPPSSLEAFHGQWVARYRLRLGVVAGRAEVSPRGRYDSLAIKPDWLSDSPYTRASNKLRATHANLSARLRGMLDEAGCQSIPMPTPVPTPTPTPKPTPTPPRFEALVDECGGAMHMRQSIVRAVIPPGQLVEHEDGSWSLWIGENVKPIRVLLDRGWEVQQVKRRIWPMLPDGPDNREWETIAEGHITEDCEVIRRP